MIRSRPILILSRLCHIGQVLNNCQKNNRNGSNSFFNVSFRKSVYSIFTESPGLNVDLKEAQCVKSVGHRLISREKELIFVLSRPIKLCHFSHMPTQYRAI